VIIATAQAVGFDVFGGHYQAINLSKPLPEGETNKGRQ